MRALLTATAALTLSLVSATPALPQGYAPGVAAAKMIPAPGLTVNLFAAEPDISQPILAKFDDRGRLWTIQYLQYPLPAGLKRVKVDRWSRAVYDRVPEPPPKGPRGADRITICADTDGDGRADSFKDFVTGLNLCTGLAFGHGSLYKVSPLAKTATPLLTGSIPNQPVEPVAWVNGAGRSQVFYTSLGGPQDFQTAAFRRLLANAILWALDQPIPAE